MKRCWHRSLITGRKVHSVSLGYLWHLRCYHAKEVLHIPQNKFAPDEIFSRIVTNPECFGTRFVSSFRRRCVNFESEN